MPELPEVEYYRRLATTVLGRSVTGLSLPDLWFLKGGTTQRLLEAAVIGSRFSAVRRIGKLLLLDLEHGPALGLHFGMTGTLVVDGVSGVDHLLYAPQRHRPEWERFGVRFADGGTLVVHDPRRLGGVTLDPDVSRLGPDALVVSAGELALALRQATGPLKARLLEQSRVAGIGNLVGDEVLWRAGLSPVRDAGSLTQPEIQRLHRTLRSTLAALIRRGGSHLGDLMDERHVAGRCPKDGAELTRSTVGGRTSWWCPLHQR